MSKLFARRPRGFVLLPVVLAITLVAAIAFLINRESAIQVNMAAAEAQVSAAQYVAEAGLNHALWLANQANCSGYTDLVDIPLGTHKYSATITPTSGSPVNISATGTHTSGAIYSINHDGINISATNITAILQPAAEGKDVYIADGGQEKNYGGFPQLSLKPDGQRVLIHFDISSIPIGAVVRSAIFELFFDNLPVYKGPTDYLIHRLTRDWIEGTATTGSAPVDGASWNTYDGSNLWTTPGGDYYPAIEASTPLNEITLGWHTWDITGLVSNWVSNSVVFPNNGMIVTPTGAANGPKIWSSDYADSTLRPKLTITYVCECGVVCA